MVQHVHGDLLEHLGLLRGTYRHRELEILVLDPLAQVPVLEQGLGASLVQSPAFVRKIPVFVNHRHHRKQQRVPGKVEQPGTFDDALDKTLRGPLGSL